MKIVSDNPELLEELYSKLRLEGIDVEKKEQPSNKKEMSGELETIGLLIFQYASNAWFVKDVVIALAEHFEAQIKIELKNGETIGYLDYVEMTEDERHALEIFKV